MNFYWNDWSPLNLSYDLAFVGGFGVVWLLCALLFRGLRGPAQSAGRSALLAFALHFPLSMIFIAARPHAGFLVVHYFWTMLTAALPLSCILIARRWSGAARAALALAAFALLLLKLYAEAIEPRQLQTDHFAIEDRRISAPVRIAHITDLQTDGIGPMHWQARQQLRSFQPDLIVFTGDVLNHPRLIPEVADFLHSLAAPGRSYLIRGDHDAGLPGASFAARSGFRWFDGQSEIITIRGAQLKLIGLGRPDMRHMATVDLLTRPRRAGEAQLYTIVLSHPPDALFAAERRGVDLLIAGHTHGGQIALPFFGPPLTLTRAPRRIGAGGLHRYGRLEVLVSRGLGMEGHVAPRIRFLCRPQLSLLELRPASSAH